MKQILKALFAALSGHVLNTLAAWAEYGNQFEYPAFRSNSDYSGLGSARYVIVWQNGTYKGELATVATSSTLLGVLQNAPKVNEAMAIAYSGPSKVVAGGALSAGVIFTTNGSGRAAAVASGQVAIGRTLEAAGADGDIVSCMLFPPVRWAGAA